MKLTQRRITSLLLTLLVLIGIVPSLPNLASAVEPDIDVTRSEWLQALVTTFEMSVENEEYPDNYFSDLSSDSKYYYDMLLAVEFGLVDVPAGGELRPDDVATREFAAQTLNFCLGYQLPDGTVFTYKEHSDVSSPEALQIAINRNWFALSDGAILPEQPITSAEKDAMIKDAEAILESQTIQLGHENAFQYKDGVIVIPQSVSVHWNDSGKLVLNDCSLDLTSGNIIAVTENIFPKTYTVASVAGSSKSLVLTVTEVPIEEYLTGVDAQGSTTGDLKNFEAAEGIDPIYILSDNTRTRDIGRIKDSVSVKSIYIEKKIGDIQLICDITNMTVDYRVSGIPLINLDAYVALNGTTYASCTVPFGASVSDYSDSLLLGYYPVLGVGAIEIRADISVDGSVTVSYSGAFKAGVAYTTDDGFRKINGFQKKNFSLTVQAELGLGMSVRLTTADIPFISANCYIGTGIRVNFKYVTRGADVTPKVCIHTDAWLYAEAGCYASINVGKIDPISETFPLYDRSNSPARSVTHYEDGELVSKCTYDKSGKEFGSYYSSSSSRYVNGGLSSVVNLPTYTYDQDENGNALITGYSGKVYSLSIPDTIDGHTVTAIKAKAFKNCKGLTAVTLPATVTAIGKEAFSGCTNLMSVNIPNGVAAIEDKTFLNCSNLRTIVIPDSVITIGESAFNGCGSLARVTMSNDVESFGAEAFENCISLTEIYIPKSLTQSGGSEYSDGYGAFTGCTALKTVNFESGITEVPAYLFQDCPGIEKIAIPDTVTVIENYAFCNAAALKTVVIPDTVTSIGKDVFRDCVSLSFLKMSNNVESFGAEAFENCISLTEIYIPKSLTQSGGSEYSDGYGAFTGCTALKTVNFESGITEVPAYLFQDCPGIEKIAIPDTVTVIENYAFCNAAALKTVVIPDTVTSIGKDVFRDCVSLSFLKMSNNVESFGAEAFENCISLTEIYIPKSLTQSGGSEYSDGYGAFTGCTALKTVNFESGITKVPAYLFQGCSGIEEITIPDTVTWIGEYAFEGATALKSIAVPESVTELDAFAFASCTSLTTTQWNHVLTEIPESTFKGCSSLKTFDVPIQVAKIHKNAFNGCTALERFTGGNGLTQLGESTFKNCDALTTVTVPNSITSLGASCFYDCDAMTNITLSDTLTTIGGSCFNDCDALTEIAIPNSVTKIGTLAFYHCDALKTVTLSSAVTQIPEGCFQLCVSLEEILLPRSVTKVDKHAFNSCTKLVKAVVPRSVMAIDNNAFSYPEIMTIYGIAGTYAETYATENNFPFVHQPVNATKITLNNTELTMNKKGTHVLTITAIPADFTDEINWKSSNEEVVTVAADGTVTAKGLGTATVKVTVGSLSASCKITVIQPVTSIRLNQNSLTLDALEIYTLKATVSPESAHDRSVTWSSSDDSVASVDQNGLVTAHTKGDAIITVSAQDGSECSATCKVTVSNTAHIVTSMDKFQSPHNYENNCSDFWSYTLADASALSVTFDTKTHMEDEFDFIRIFDGEGNRIGEYTGTALAGTTVEVPGDTVRVQIISDDVGVEWGFKVVAVSPVIEEIAPVKSAQLSADNSKIVFEIDEKALDFEQMFVGIFDSDNGKMLSVGVLHYDGKTRIFEIMLPANLPNDFLVKAFYTDMNIVPTYQSSSFSAEDLKEL